MELPAVVTDIAVAVSSIVMRRDREADPLEFFATKNALLHLSDLCLPLLRSLMQRFSRVTDDGHSPLLRARRWRALIVGEELDDFYRPFFW